MKAAAKLDSYVMDNQVKNISLLILAGGKSERMNSPKPFLRINGKTFIEHIVWKYSGLGLKDIKVVLNADFIKYVDNRDLNYTIISNRSSDRGRFFSLQLGLRSLSKSDYIFVHNVDNPFVEEEVIREMLIARNPESYIVPTYLGQGGHPILISAKLSRQLLYRDYQNTTLRNELQFIHRNEVPVNTDKILVNINSWNDYEESVLNLIPEYTCD